MLPQVCDRLETTGIGLIQHGDSGYFRETQLGSNVPYSCES